MEEMLKLTARRAVWAIVFILVSSIALGVVLSYVSPAVSTDAALKQFEDSKTSNMAVRAAEDSRNLIMQIAGILCAAVLACMFFAPLKMGFNLAFGDDKKSPESDSRSASSKGG